MPRKAEVSRPSQPAIVGRTALPERAERTVKRNVRGRGLDAVVDIINALGLAALLTAGFALRFRYWRNPKVLVAYFAVFLVIEWVAGHYFIPPAALGLEVGLVAFALTVPMIAAILFVDGRERRESEPDSPP